MRSHKVGSLALLIAVAAIVIGQTEAQDYSRLSVYYQWKTIEYDFPLGVTKQRLEREGKYNQTNIILTALKMYKNQVFVTTPRLRPGVPVTFSVVPARRFGFFGTSSEGPRLKPFPSYELNKEGDCNALQLVMAAEVDEHGRLWIVDAGRTDLLTDKPNNLCPSKLMIVDLENRNKITTYSFLDNVANRNVSIIKDIQIACSERDECMAYISSLTESKLLVVKMSGKSITSWAAKHPSMAPVKEEETFNIEETQSEITFGITGLALASKRQGYDTIYFSPLASTKMYQVATRTLQESRLLSDQNLNEQDVTEVLAKTGQSDGFAMDCQNNLYYGDLPNSAIYVARANGSKIENARKLVQSKALLQWPDTWSFDDKGSLFITAPTFHKWVAGTLNPKEYNYKILKINDVNNAFAYNSKNCK